MYILSIDTTLQLQLQLFCAENQSDPKDPNHRGDAANGAMHMPRSSSKTEGNNMVGLTEDIVTPFKTTEVNKQLVLLTADPMHPFQDPMSISFPMMQYLPPSKQSMIA